MNHYGELMQQLYDFFGKAKLIPDSVQATSEAINAIQEERLFEFHENNDRIGSFFAEFDLTDAAQVFEEFGARSASLRRIRDGQVGNSGVAVFPTMAFFKDREATQLSLGTLFFDTGVLSCICPEMTQCHEMSLFPVEEIGKGDDIIFCDGIFPFVQGRLIGQKTFLCVPANDPEEIMAVRSKLKNSGMSVGLATTDGSPLSEALKSGRLKL